MHGVLREGFTEKLNFEQSLGGGNQAVVWGRVIQAERTVRVKAKSEELRVATAREGKTTVRLELRQEAGLGRVEGVRWGLVGPLEGLGLFLQLEGEPQQGCGQTWHDWT